MAFLDFLTSGNTPPPVTTETNSQGQLPLWYSQYMSSLFNRAASVAGDPYQTYGGERIADFSPTQTQGFDFLKNNIGNWQGTMQNAGDAANRAARPFSATQMEKHLSPYTEGVVGQIEQQGSRYFNEQLMPGLEDAFVGAGQHGSSRHEDMALRGARDVGESVVGQSALARQRAFEAASSDYNNWTDNAREGAGTLANLAGNQLQNTLGTAGGLESVGAQERGMDQSNLDLAYGDFERQRQYPFEMTNFMSNILRGANVPTSNTTTTTAPYNGSMSPSPLSQFASLYGLYRGSGTRP